MMFPSLDHLVQLAGAHAVGSIIEGMAIAVFASALLAMISSRSSGTRFAVWFCSLLAVAGLGLAVFAPGDGVAVVRAPQVILPASWAEYAFIVWAAIAAAGLLRVCVGLGKVWRLRRSCESAPDHLVEPSFSELLQQFGCSRSIELCISDELRVPTAMGFFRPAVVLPRWVVEELSPAELRSVVMHELGHLRRWDDWTNLAQKIVRALLFFHPAVWWIDSRLSLEREMACDDLVLSRTGNARGYAECLVSLAEKAAARTGMALALAAVSRMKQTAARLSRILEHNRLVDTRMSRAAVSAVAVFSAAALMLLPHAPALVAFTNVTSTAGLAEGAGPMRIGAKAAATPVIYQQRETSPAVIPAMMRADAMSEPPAVAGGAVRSHMNTMNRHRSRLTRTALQRRRSSSPNVVQAAWRNAASPTLLLVVETQDDGNGFSTVWTLCVWQVPQTPNVGHASHVRAQEGTVSKAI